MGWSNGNVVFNITIISVPGGPPAILVYAGAPAFGNLVISLAANAGTDQFGNGFPAGLSVGEAGSAGVVVGFSGTTGIIYFPGIVPNVLNDAKIQLNVLGAGGNMHSLLTIGAAEDATQLDSIFANFAASSADGTVVPQITHTYQDSASALHRYLTSNLNTGTTITGAVTAVDPTTGTNRANPAGPETWHTPAITAAGWTTVGIGHPLRYRLDGLAGGIVHLDGAVQTTGAGPWPANTALVTLPSSYRPVLGQRLYITPSAVLAAAGGNTVNVQTNGDVRNGVAFTGAGQQLFFDGLTFPVD